MTNLVHSEELKRETMRQVLLLGTYQKAAEATGVALGTITAWKRDERAWWDRIQAELIVEIEGAYRPGWVRVLGKAVQVMEERLENGDPKLTKDGLVRVGVPAKEAAVIAGIAADKLRQFANVPARPESQEERRARLKAVVTESATVTPIKSA